MFLVVTDVVKRFGGTVALNHVRLSIGEGELVGLIGPNGSGKTTLFNVITGFLHPEAGIVKFRGEDITPRTPEEICHKGIVRTFQVVKPFGGMTVLENAMVGAFNATANVGRAREAAENTLHLVGLWHRRSDVAKSLTLSDRKRLEVARALATQPKLLLLDEAMAGLNPSELRDMMTLISKIRDTGVTLLVIEHIMAAVMSLSERVIVLHHGEKIAEGTPKDICKDPKCIQAYLGEEYLVA